MPDLHSFISIALASNQCSRLPDPFLGVAHSAVSVGTLAEVPTASLINELLGRNTVR